MGDRGQSFVYQTAASFAPSPAAGPFPSILLCCSAAAPQAAAVSVPAPGGGPEQLVLYLVLRKQQQQQQQEAELLAACQAAIRTCLSPLFKVTRILVREVLPRNASNKIMRRELRAELLAQQQAGKGSLSRL